MNEIGVEQCISYSKQNKKSSWKSILNRVKIKSWKQTIRKIK